MAYVGKGAPLFSLFERQFNEAKISFNSLGKSLKSKKALELEGKLIFLNIYLNLLSKVHFKEEKLKFELFGPFKTICKGLKRIHHFKMVSDAFYIEKSRMDMEYNSYEKYLIAEKKELYKEVYEGLLFSSPDIWEPLYTGADHYSKEIQPLMINTATTQLINEEIEYCGSNGDSHLDSQAIKEILEGLRIIIAVENITIAIGLNPLFTGAIHGEIKELCQVLNKWHQNHLFAQYLSSFLSEKDQAGTKYLELVKNIKSNKQRLTKEVAGHCKYTFAKLLS
ncbi:MAG: hypothetical protein WD426_03505 [Anditalea sp.]